MNVSIFGLGYVGCVSLGCLARDGHIVIGVDKNPNKINQINNGEPTIVEKGITELISEAHEKGAVSATSDYKHAVLHSDISIIAVGTPSLETGHLNLEFILKVAREIGEALRYKNDFHIISIRSTVPPGTNKKVVQAIEETSGKKNNTSFATVSNPEFLREGSAIKDYYAPPFTAIGSESDLAFEMVSGLYEKVDGPILRVRMEVAELIKYVNNAWHAVKISFANEVGNISKELGLDSREVMDLFVRDDKLNLSRYYLKPGFAYGGSCLPKDLKALNAFAHELYLKSPLLNSVDNSNQNQIDRAIELVEKTSSRKIGVIGLSFKPGTDDIRHSPIVNVIEYFIGKGHDVKIFDHNVNQSKLMGTNKEFIDLHIPHLSRIMVDDMDRLISDSEVIVITQKVDGIEEWIRNSTDKKFIDLVGVITDNPSNYIGICW